MYTDAEHAINNHNYKKTASFTKMRKTIIKNHKDKIAIAMSVANRMYNKVDFDNDLDPTTIFYAGLSKVIDQMKIRYAEFPGNDAMTVMITGHDAEVPHARIDSDLVAKFGNDVLTDSESGMFSVMTNTRSIDKVNNYLETNYESLNFEVVSVDASELYNLFTPVISELSNWTKAEDYVAKNDLEAKVIELLVDYAA